MLVLIFLFRTLYLWLVLLQYHSSCHVILMDKFESSHSGNRPSFENKKTLSSSYHKKYF